MRFLECLRLADPVCCFDRDAASRGGFFYCQTLQQRRHQRIALPFGLRASDSLFPYLAHRATSCSAASNWLGPTLRVSFLCSAATAKLRPSCSSVASRPVKFCH